MIRINMRPAQIQRLSWRLIQGLGKARCRMVASVSILDDDQVRLGPSQRCSCITALGPHCCAVHGLTYLRLSEAPAM